MAEYKISYPNTELMGAMLYSLWAAFPDGFQELIKKILAKHGITDVVPENWYPLQPLLDALREIEDTYGHHLLWQVGEQAASRAPLPPEINSLKACLLSLNATLQRIHRNGAVAGYDVQEVTEHEGITKYRITASTPYPCSLTRGYLEGYSRRFTTPDLKEVLVRHDETSPCRRDGADSCTYIVTCF